MDIWDKIKKEARPVVLYGTGSGADAVIDRLRDAGVEISGIFASSGFVRERCFRGIKVKSFEECKKAFPDMLVLMCFGSSREDVIENVKRIAVGNEVLVPEVPVCGSQFFTREFYENNRGRLCAVKKKLSDEKSVKTFESLIEFKLSGRLDCLFGCEESESEALGLLNIPDGAVYMDLGAYNGDTVLHYCKSFRFSQILACEPDKRNFRKLIENTRTIKNIQYFNCLISDSCHKAFLNADAGRGSKAADGKGRYTPVYAADAEALLKKSGAAVSEKKLFIKADIEGGELEFIKGAENLIKNYSPVMRIACYHRSEDYFSLPCAVFRLKPDYKLYMRHIKGIPAWETDFIFIP